jgi:hypothetical protein
MDPFPEHLSKLAQFRNFISHAETAWPAFQALRAERLTQAQRNGGAAEKVAEDILGDFFTTALDWGISDLNHQVGRADIILTRSGIKRLLIEAKRPGLLNGENRIFWDAREQAHRYADEQHVRTIAVSDGNVFHAFDIVNGGLEERVQLRLDSTEFQPDSWWVSKEGVDRPAEILMQREFANEENIDVTVPPGEIGEVLLHKKYKVPANCFAYVPDASDPSTWKLPCWKVYGEEVDTVRLSGAIRAVVTNYRGAHATVPEESVSDVLVRLGKAASKARKLPGQDPNPKDSYRQLYQVLDQFGRLGDL